MRPPRAEDAEIATWPFPPPRLRLAGPKGHKAMESKCRGAYFHAIERQKGSLG